MKIDKNYKNLKRLDDGDYYLSGEIRTEEELVIELNDRLKVEKGVYAQSIKINTTLITGDGITAGDGIEAGCVIKAGWEITAGFGIKAGYGIKAGDGITAGGGITAGWGIEAGDGIKAKTFISSQKRIFAGISIYKNAIECDKTIKCAELQNGEIAYGELIITEKEKG